MREAVIGMAHRGRLNVLVNILGKHPGALFGEFEGETEVGVGSGDVKYHLGFSSTVETPGGPIHLVLAFNPSHLEIINPVVEGSVRARQERRGDASRDQVMPILIHGDAAFSGQGVVTETLNLSETRGYGTGGTVHVVVNNQIGFTTSDPLDSRSTLYCTDVAKLVQAPIFHVNGNDAEAVVFVANLALDFRMRFKKDVVIDMICFRRYGHNEADEPLATQPMMYKKIRNQPGPRKFYADRLVAEGVVEPGEPEAMSDAYLAALEANRVVSRPLVDDRVNPLLVDWTHYIGTDWRAPGDTAVTIERIERLGKKLCEYPADDFELHRSVKRIVDARGEMARGERADGLGVRREPRVRDPSRGRLLGAPVRSGQPARHLLPPPRGAAQPEAIRHLDAARTPVRRPAPISCHQLDALRGRGPRVRVRVLHRRTARAGRLGGPIRGLREHGAGRHRPVPQLLGGEVGPVLRAGADAPARVRRPGARALLRPPGTFPPALRGGEHAGVRTDDPGPDVPPPQKAAPAALPQAARHHESQEPAAAPAVDLDARGSVQGRVPGAHRRDRRHRIPAGSPGS